MYCYVLVYVDASSIFIYSRSRADRYLDLLVVYPLEVHFLKVVNHVVSSQLLDLFPLVTRTHRKHGRASCQAGLDPRWCIFHHQASLDVFLECCGAVQIWFRVWLAMYAIFGSDKVGRRGDVGSL